MDKYLPLQGVLKKSAQLPYGKLETQPKLRR